MYISRYNLVQIKFNLQTFKGKVEEMALIDSGATANFIERWPDYDLGHKNLNNSDQFGTLMGPLTSLETSPTAATSWCRR